MVTLVKGILLPHNTSQWNATHYLFLLSSLSSSFFFLMIITHIYTQKIQLFLELTVIHKFDVYKLSAEGTHLDFHL